MQCSECQHDNREGAKFCKNCGAKLECLCPSCGNPYDRDSVFCDECGHRLNEGAESAPREPVFDDKLDKIQRYLPKGLAEKILSQKDKIEGERKQVTVMFCDMKGFTSLSEKLGSETVYSLMDEVYEVLIQKVHEYEGTVNEMTGDGVMALFGAPIALEDAPQRAIRSAMAIHREMTKFNEKLKSEKGAIPSIKIRAGIHTGPVVVGTLGNNLRVEFKAVGDTVNLASRMESIAEPGTTYMTEETFKATEGLFRVESLGERAIKGKEKPIRVYQVIAPSTRRTRFDVSAERGLTPFVGRLRSLEMLMDSYQRSKDGRGQAVSIISEAGIGKSRTLYEFRKAVIHEDNTFLEGKCLSYSHSAAYHPIVDVLKANFEIQDNDTDAVIRKKVSQGLKTIGVEEGGTIQYLLALLAVKDSGIDNISMSPETRKDRTIQALKKIVLKGSEYRPLIIAIEDLHWIDNSSEDVLKEMLESISGSRVLLIFTYRPEYIPKWGNRSYHNQITLNRLSNRESLTMMNYLLNNADIDKDIEHLILAKTEGIPFFIEEFIKSLKERNVIEKRNGAYKLIRDFNAISIPSTIQDVIMARVDHLPEGAREVLRAGSLIEREFSHEMIKMVTGLAEETLLSHLSTLRGAELLYERGIYPNSTYIFKHSLTREVVYDSILSANRKKLHQKIARSIEELYEDNICDCYGTLSNHCMACEDYEKAAEYARLEARKYQKEAAFRDAIEYARRWIACLEKRPQTEEVLKQLIDGRVLLSTYLLNLNYHCEAKEAVEPVMQLALDLDYQKKLPGIYTAMGVYYAAVEEDFHESKKYLKDVSEIAAKVGDFLALWLVNYQMGTMICHDFQFDESLSCLTTILDISVLSKKPEAISHSKAAFAFNYNTQGKLDLAFQMSAEAMEGAIESEDILALQAAYANHGFSHYYKGNLPEAERCLCDALMYYEKASQGSWGLLAAAVMAFACGEMKEYAKAILYSNQAIAIMEDTQFLTSWINVLKLFCVKQRLLNPDSEIDFNKLNALVISHEQSRLAQCESYGARCIAEIYLHMDDGHMAEAEAWIKRAIAFNTKHDTLWLLACDYALYADWFRKNGERSKAKEQLARAVGLFEECGADGWVEKYEKQLAAM